MISSWVGTVLGFLSWMLAMCFTIVCSPVFVVWGLYNRRDRVWGRHYHRSTTHCITDIFRWLSTKIAASLWLSTKLRLNLCMIFFLFGFSLDFHLHQSYNMFWCLIWVSTFSGSTFIIKFFKSCCQFVLIKMVSMSKIVVVSLGSCEFRNIERLCVWLGSMFTSLLSGA